MPNQNRHVALLTTENLPVSPQPCAGGGIRAWSLGEGLRQAGHECTYFIHEKWREALSPVVTQTPIHFYRPETVRDDLEAFSCDAVLVEQWQPLTLVNQPLSKPVIVDLPGPLALEYAWHDPDMLLQHFSDKLLCLAKADYAICAHERQQGYYIGWLVWAGFEPAECRIDVAPFTMHEMPRGRQGLATGEPALFWGGMFWPWQERTAAFEAIAETLYRLRRGQIVVVGAEPHEEVVPEQLKDYAEHPNVSWLGRLGFMEYIQELKQSIAAIDLCQATLERRLSSDLRTGTSLWAGTPCLAAPESPWAAAIEEYNAGWVIPYANTKALTRWVESLVLEREDLTGKRRGAKAVSSMVSDPKRLEPLLRMLKKPEMRAKKPPRWDQRTMDREQRLRDLQGQVDALTHECGRLQHDLDSIRSNPLFRLYKKIAGLFG